MKSLPIASLFLLVACGGRAAPSATTPIAPIDADDLPTMLSCWNGGEVLFRETTRTIDQRAARPDVLTIYESGAWRLEGRREKSGCLPADEVAALEAQLRAVRRDAPDAAMCAAVPTHDTLIEVPDVGALSYQWPCAPGPDADTTAGIELARDLTWRRS